MTVRLGGGQGFYGDGRGPLADLLVAGVDYLVCEALAELTLAIMVKDRQKDEAGGWARDLPAYVAAALDPLMAGRTRLITNAGGINPLAAAREIVRLAGEVGARGLKVAVVTGDDIRPHADRLAAEGRPLPADALFANVYLGAGPIVEALAAGADIVITGRVADASLFLAPLIHEFGWSTEDWDRLAGGVVVGHLLECSGQVTGGNYSGAWWENPDPFRIGFPIAECEPDGSAVITKPPDTGGWVTFDTVREQLLYEVHDPRSYLNPDVTADFTSVVVEDLGSDRVRVSGCSGARPPATYKGLVCRPGGWSGEVRVAYGWPDAEAKVRAAFAFLRHRADEIGVPVEEWCEEIFGLNACHGPTVDLVAMDRSGWEPADLVGRLAWRCAERSDAARVMGEAGHLGLCGPPMTAPAGRARDRPTQLLALEEMAVDRKMVDAMVRVGVETT